MVTEDCGGGAAGLHIPVGERGDEGVHGIGVPGEAKSQGGGAADVLVLTLDCGDECHHCARLGAPSAAESHCSGTAQVRVFARERSDEYVEDTRPADKTKGLGGLYAYFRVPIRERNDERLDGLRVLDEAERHGRFPANVSVIVLECGDKRLDGAPIVDNAEGLSRGPACAWVPVPECKYKRVECGVAHLAEGLSDFLAHVHVVVIEGGDERLHRAYVAHLA